MALVYHATETGELKFERRHDWLHQHDAEMENYKIRHNKMLHIRVAPKSNHSIVVLQTIHTEYIFGSFVFDLPVGPNVLMDFSRVTNGEADFGASEHVHYALNDDAKN